ncbi:hypothetical protein FB567DRAFT_123339 [Paraphoma chrysanthemicola]|uniref:Uncharacterized protein n=1 Tax=Paraphoma chrysanthemicola TaxID=798071 RepID=A0A8K0QYZ8_9PLEO|nr:hypothetical protein FB567DRAFT_123339 [Paraphoma chrysanthemicola]
MHDFNEARTPLTSESVQSWGRANFPVAFRTLPRPARLKWTTLDEFDLKSNRAVYRSLHRSAHKQLLVIGGYAPGPEVDDEPADVLAHMHHDEAGVTFYRAMESVYGTKQELELVRSTSLVAFHEPFCHVGDDAGGSKAIHRVSALIEYYFLAAGHVKELIRTKGDPTLFTRNFKDACAWVENEGERPNAPPSRRVSGIITSPPLSGVPVRPKRSSTISSLSQSTTAEDTPTPPLLRSATDSISVKIKREREEDSYQPPKKHPRRTLSEQIVITKFPDSVLSPKSPIPRSPAPERVNRALTERINHLKEEMRGLKSTNSTLEGERDDLNIRMTKQAEELNAVRTDAQQMQQDLALILGKMRGLENEIGGLKGRLDKCEKKSKG